jgi:Conserved hypothetical protein (DUF2461)
VIQDPSFTKDLFSFLLDLRKNNNRGWFQANKPRYEQHVQEPALEFVSDFAPLLDEISPHFRADPRPVGGSLFRIYRDVRFSKDKSPYKTVVGIRFRHELGKDAHAPVFYLHLEPGPVVRGRRPLASGLGHAGEDPSGDRGLPRGLAFRRPGRHPSQPSSSSAETRSSGRRRATTRSTR